MFATTGEVEDGKQSASDAATQQVKLWESVIGLRISLQRSLDASNKLPSSDVINDVMDGNEQGGQQIGQVREGLMGLVSDLNNLLDVQARQNLVYWLFIST